ncbi:Sec-independent protein translocase protein TatB [Hyphomicrobium sp.]|uniref:Sec-independent protein translocase protein TatB n=1 Tax=Hyphomicrobium sp. TaxID=82 RepID=UPI002E36E64C|nr:Sec-independent protein translocase protein TatB [Hyphomicrobium sp.]HEX2843564.1 Sec-independent protein translocase protein TatB [Hyphomicrobium sp.]
MFDVSWSELLILGIVTLIFVGPKELPRFLGQLGKYAGVVRRQANEFRAVFEQAMREAEMDQIQKEMRAMSDGVKSSLDEATRSIDTAKNAAKVDLDAGPAPLPSASEPAAPEASAAEPAPSILPPAANSSGNDVSAASGEAETPDKAPPSTSPGSV